MQTSPTQESPMTCNMMNMALIALCILVVITAIYKLQERYVSDTPEPPADSYQTVEQPETPEYLHLDNNELIGVIYPPKAGSLSRHPGQRLTAIYRYPPFLVEHY